MIKSVFDGLDFCYRKKAVGQKYLHKTSNHNCASKLILVESAASVH